MASRVRVAGRAQAWLSILLAIFVIAELTLFIGVLNETAVTLLVAPLARILTVLRTQAARVMQSMERSEARLPACQCIPRLSHASAQCMRAQPQLSST